MWVVTRDDGSRTSRRTVAKRALWDPRVVSGIDPSSSILWWCDLAQDLNLRCVRRPASGGDEETRTPDPLLAKEMLCQLSYVPLHRDGMVGVSGLEPETSALSGQCSNQLS